MTTACPVRSRAFVLGVACVLSVVLAPFAGEAGDEPAGPRRKLVIVGGARLPEVVRAKFVELAGGPKATIVVIPTASSSADDRETRDDYFGGQWRRAGVERVSILHTRSREEADDQGFVAPLRQATGVWFSGGDQSRVTAAYVGTAVEDELQALLARGGVIGGTSAGAAIQSPVMIAGGRHVAEVCEGFPLLTGAVIDQHFLRRNRLNRLLGVLRDRPQLVGYGIDESTALIVEGDRLRVLGESVVLACWAHQGDRPLRIDILRPGRTYDFAEHRRFATNPEEHPWPPPSSDVSAAARSR